MLHLVLVPEVVVVEEAAKLLSTKTIVAAEKSWMSFQIDKTKTLTYKNQGGSNSGQRGRGGRGGRD